MVLNYFYSSDFPSALSRVEVSIKSGPIKQEPQQHGSGLKSDGDLMPPPTGPPPHRKKGSKSSKNKIFKCCECHRAFKKVQKLVKHVERKHSKPKPTKRAHQKSLQEQQQPLQQQPSQQQQQPPEEQNDHPESVIIKTESPETNRDVTSGEKSSLKLTPMGCPDCNLIFGAKDEMMRHFAQEPHKLSEGISVNRCPG